MLVCFLMLFPTCCFAEREELTTVKEWVDEITLREGEYPYYNPSGFSLQGGKAVYDSKILISNTRNENGTYYNGIFQIHVGFQEGDKLDHQALFSFGVPAAKVSASGEALAYNLKEDAWYQVRVELDLDQFRYRVTLKDAENALIKQSNWANIPASTKINYNNSSFVSIRMMKGDENSERITKMKDMILSTAKTYYAVSASIAGSGTVSCGDTGLGGETAAEIEGGKSAEIHFTPADENTELKSVLVNGEDQTALVQNGILTLDNLAADQALTVTFGTKEKTEPTVSSDTVINGNYQPAGAEEAVPAAMMYSKINLGYGYSVSGASVSLVDLESGNQMQLPVTQWTANGTWGIRIYGKGLQTGGNYSMQSVITYEKEGETEQAFGDVQDFTMNK